MSMWGFARNATKSYLTNLNASAASRLVTGGWRAGGIRGAASGASRYFMGGGTAGRIARMGTGAGIIGAGVAGRVGRGKMEDRYGKVGMFGPSADQTKQMLDDRGINYS